MSQSALYFGFALPVGMIILTNLIIYVLVVLALCRRRDMTKHSTTSSKRDKQVVVNIKASFVFFCLLGEFRIYLF